MAKHGKMKTLGIDERATMTTQIIKLAAKLSLLDQRAQGSALHDRPVLESNGIEERPPTPVTLGSPDNRAGLWFRN